MAQDPKKTVPFILGQIDQKLDDLSNKVENSTEETKKVLGAHAQDINELKEWRSNLKGKAAGFIFLGSGSIALLFSWIKSHFFTQ